MAVILWELEVRSCGIVISLVVMNFSVADMMPGLSAMTLMVAVVASGIRHYVG